MAVSDERAQSNVFTEPLDANDFNDTTAVRQLMEKEERAADDDAGEACFVLGTMAMDDVNTTTFGQQRHVSLSREHGAMQPVEMLTYRGVPPRGGWVPRGVTPRGDHPHGE